MPKIDVYQKVTDKLIAQIEKGVRPWAKSWTGTVTGSTLPLRHNGEPYRGINILLLWSEGRGNPYWMTYKQAQEYGGNVRKGEKAAKVVFFKQIEVKDRDNPDETTNIPMLKEYAVFNALQIEGLPERFYPEHNPVEVNSETTIAHCDDFLKNTGANISHEAGDRAYYRPSTDQIVLPKFCQFHDAVAYYGTAFHELIHWTGAEKRCNRDLKNKFGTKDYAREELVAELGAAFLCAALGIEPEPREDHASYLKSWLDVLKNDKRAIFRAATMAQAGCDHVWSLQPVEQEKAA